MFKTVICPSDIEKHHWRWMTKITAKICSLGFMPRPEKVAIFVATCF